VALLFVFPQVVSLWLCCCTFGGRPKPLAETPEPTPSACRSCCHDLANTADGESIAPATKTCPCRQFVMSMLEGDLTVPEPGITGEPIGLPLALVPLESSTHLVPLIVPDRPGEIAFHPPDHRQRYHHVLRC
jgi:hypothetical protein